MPRRLYSSAGTLAAEPIEVYAATLFLAELSVLFGLSEQKSFADYVHARKSLVSMNAKCPIANVSVCL